MIQLKKFQEKVSDSLLPDDEKIFLYESMKNFCTLCVDSQRKTGERLELYSALQKILSKKTESKSLFLRSIAVDFLRIEIDDRIRKIKNNETYFMDADSLNKVGEVLKKHLGWTASDTKNALKDIKNVQQKNRELLGPKAWKGRLLTGLIVIATAGVGYATYKHIQNKSENGKENEKK